MAQDLTNRPVQIIYTMNIFQQNFSRTDLIFRFQKNIRLRAQACQQLARILCISEVFLPNPIAAEALNNLHTSMQEWVEPIQK